MLLESDKNIIGLPKFIHTSVYKNNKVYKLKKLEFSMLLSKKSIISINEEFDNGHVVNEGSLDFAINTARKSDNWLKSLAILVRAILIDHIFEDGNKRTAAAVVVAWLEMENLHCNIDSVNKLIIKILKKNITSLNEIIELIKNATEE